MDTRGLTWTNTFSHVRLAMTKTPGRQLLPGVLGGPCQGCQIVYVGPWLKKPLILDTLHYLSLLSPGYLSQKLEI